MSEGWFRLASCREPRPVYRVKAWRRPNEDECDANTARSRALAQLLGRYSIARAMAAIPANVARGDLQYIGRISFPPPSRPLECLRCFPRCYQPLGHRRA